MSATLTFLNSGILTAYGVYTYEPVSLERARELIRTYSQSGGNIRSYVGHQTTADLMSRLLGYPVQVHRGQYVQEAGDVAIVFKLKGRPPEGAILSLNELEAVGYEFGLLTRTA